MKKWALMLSVIALSNGLCAMGDDWEHVEDDAAQLVQDLVAIAEQANEWNTINAEDAARTTQDDAIITLEGNTINFNLTNDYPTSKPSAPISVPTSPLQRLHVIVVAASPAPSSTSYNSGLSSSANSQSSLSSNHRIAPKPTPPPPASKLNANTMSHQHSPIGLRQTVAASLLDMASSMISNASIETSADEDGGISRCVVHGSDYDTNGFEDDSGKKKVEKKQQEKQRLPEELTLTEFANEFFNPAVTWVKQQLEKIEKL
jgi:hypothetical protein